MPKMKLVVENDLGRFEEIYDKHVNDPQAYAEGIIAYFNATLKPDELPRRLVSVTLLGAGNSHNWEKSNLTTQFRGHRLYDTARCTLCGVTGKRYGLSGTVKRDSRFRAKKWETCDPSRPLPVEKERD